MLWMMHGILGKTVKGATEGGGKFRGRGGRRDKLRETANASSCVNLGGAE